MNRFSRISAFKRLKITVNHIVGRRMSTNNECSAGIIVIGDEILKGQTEDTNSHFICKHLFSLGVKVKKISVIGDDLDTIAREVSLFSKSFTHVITTGGIGPTHDDKTFEGIAKAFDDVLEPNPVLVELCKEYFGPASLDSPKMKLAMHLFKNPSKDFYTREIYVDKDEVSIADILNTVDSKHNNTVILGSYPDFNNSYYKVKLVLESETKKDLDDACQTLTESLPKDCIVEYDKSPIHHAVDKVYGIVNSCERCEYTKNVREAVKILEECLDKYGRLDFKSILCEEHPDEACCLYCDSCDQTVCPVCVAKTHKSHNLLEIKEKYEVKTDNLNKEKIKLQSEKEYFNHEKEKLDSLKSDEKSKYNFARQEILTQELHLKEEVGKFAKHLLDDLDEDGQKLRRNLT
ncbi:FLAD1 [Mytilus edulis]|uniref:FLAD1 n=1 Tax=Mytilus edulis TaxID=6550 RepID=A0A8S3S7P2_MYTED|nr:FLAD1 [Mytilus edulis]